MTYALGIDLGTTYTAAAIARQGRAEVAALGYRATSVPTLVLLTADGRFLVGEAADRRATSEPDRVAREFKRRVGDPTPLLLGGTPVAVDRCLAELLAWVVTTTSESEGEPPAAVTVTHPANWGEFKRDVLREALRLADVPAARLLPEPVAAATWYAQAERMAPGRTIAVYDLGGGTFDTTVLRRRPDGEFEALGQPEGIERLGGIDIDEAVLGHVLRAVEQGGASALGLDTDEPAVRAATTQLRRACVEAKEGLSSETSVTIPVWLPGAFQQIRMNRSELEQLIEPLLRPTVDALARVVASAGLRPDDLDAVLLVGGSSRIPLIAQQVSAGLGRPIAVDAHPKHPVALGAALDADAHLAAATAASAASTGSGAAASAALLASGVASSPTWGPRPVPGPAAAGPTAWSGGMPSAHSSDGALPPLVTSNELSPSHRRLLMLAYVATPLTVALVAFFFFILSRNGADDGDDTKDDAATSGQTVPAADGGFGGAPASTTVAPTFTPVNLLTGDASPAIQAFSAIYETPPRVRELHLWVDDASIGVQVPGNPTYVDAYRWENGEVTGPEPQQLMDMEVEELEAKLFDLTEVDPAVIPSVVQQTMQSCPGEGLVIDFVSIERDLDFDEQHRVLISVFASHPERGGGGYITYTLDGTLVENLC